MEASSHPEYPIPGDLDILTRPRIELHGFFDVGMSSYVPMSNTTSIGSERKEHHWNFDATTIQVLRRGQNRVKVGINLAHLFRLLIACLPCGEFYQHCIQVSRSRTVGFFIATFSSFNIERL
jgi:hypothetical protein